MHFHVIFLWLPSSEHAIGHVADRVRRGGHHVPDEIVRRRYHVGLKNFLRLYQPMATTWRLYDNAGANSPVLVAKGGKATESRIYDSSTWRSVTKGMDHEARA